MKKTKGPRYIATQVYPQLDPNIKHPPYGEGKYGSLKKKYPRHWSSFWNIHERCPRKGIEIESYFRRNFQGLANFIEHLGPIPRDMVDPTVGRLDHKLGYVRGNMFWQSRAENSREAARRNDVRHKALRYKLIGQLVEACPALRSGEYVEMPSTFIAWVWSMHATDVKYYSHDVHKYLKTFRDKFDGLVDFKQTAFGRGRKPAKFDVKIDSSLIAEIDAATHAGNTLSSLQNLL